jgi:hypothetical protein
VQKELETRIDQETSETQIEEQPATSSLLAMTPQAPSLKLFFCWEIPKSASQQSYITLEWTDMCCRKLSWIKVPFSVTCTQKLVDSTLYQKS